MSKKFKKNGQVPQGSISEGWNVGGTLHKATVSQWHNSKFGNGLATCADWVQAFKELNGTSVKDDQGLDTGRLFDTSSLDISTGDKYLAACLRLQQAVTEGTRKHVANIADHSIAQYAMISAGALGWLKIQEPQ